MHARLAAGQQQAHVLPGAQRLANGRQLGGGQRGRRGHAELIQVAADPQRHQEILQRQIQRVHLAQPAPQQRGQLGQAGFQPAGIPGPPQQFEHLELRAGDEGGGILPAGFDPAHLERPILEDPEVAVGHGDARIAPRRQESHPAVDPIQADRQPGALQDRIQHRLEVLRGGRAVLFDPHAVHVHVQNGEPELLGGLLGLQQRLAPVGGDRLVGLDAPEARVLVAQVAEAGDQQPLVGRGVGLVAPAARVPGRQQGQVALERHALLQQRAQRARDQTLVLAVDLQPQAGDGLGRGHLGADRLGRDVEMHHHAGVHGDEVDLAHVAVQPDGRLVDQPALVGGEELGRALEVLGLLLVPGDQDAALQRHRHLHGGDAGAGRDARGGLHRQPGDARQFEHPFQPVIAPHHGVVGVDMPAAGQVHLLAAVDDLVVGEVGALRPVEDAALRVAVERQRDAVLLRQLEQPGQQPGIAPARQQQVRILLLQDGAQVQQERARRAEAQLAAVLLVLDRREIGARHARGWHPARGSAP